MHYLIIYVTHVITFISSAHVWPHHFLAAKKKKKTKFDITGLLKLRLNKILTLSLYTRAVFVAIILHIII